MSASVHSSLWLPASSRSNTSGAWDQLCRYTPFRGPCNWSRQAFRYHNAALHSVSRGLESPLTEVLPFSAGKRRMPWQPCGPYAGLCLPWSKTSQGQGIEWDLWGSAIKESFSPRQLWFRPSDAISPGFDQRISLPFGISKTWENKLHSIQSPPRQNCNG